MLGWLGDMTEYVLYSYYIFNTLQTVIFSYTVPINHCSKANIRNGCSVVNKSNKIVRDSVEVN